MNDADTIELTSEIISSYVAHNPVSAHNLPGLIRSVHDTLSGLGTPAPEPAIALKPAVPIGKSISDDFIICLEDGKKFKSLKRHIAKLGMTPETYREKWGLKPDYPMVAPNYAAVRSNLAKANGLGKKPILRQVA